MISKEIKTAISLFCSGGIGDLALREQGIEILVANELLQDRMEIYKSNSPTTTCLQGDINKLKFEIVATTKKRLNGRSLDLLYATPPCQGMSTNGAGTIRNSIRKGKRPALDPRNQLIIPVMEIAKELKPRFILLENVVGMENTTIETPNGEYKKILDYVTEELSEYVGKAEIVQFADYGVPQTRKRLITVYTRDENAKRFFTKFAPYQRERMWESG